MKDGKIQTFTDLKVWQEGHALVIAIYQATKSFPKGKGLGTGTFVSSFVSESPRLVI